MKKPLVALYKLDDLFKEGDVIYDKETDKIFIYKKQKHRDIILNSPNNYRVAHKGDKANKKIKG